MKKEANKKVKKPEITDAMFKELQQELRELDLKWVEKLTAQISADKKVEKEILEHLSERKIYNVFNGIVRDGAWKVLVYQQAQTLKNTFLKKVENVLT